MFQLYWTTLTDCNTMLQSISESKEDIHHGCEAISYSSQCSTTDKTKAVVCTILSVGHKRSLAASWMILWLSHRLRYWIHTPEDSTYHGSLYATCGALVGMKNSSQWSYVFCFVFVSTNSRLKCHNMYGTIRHLHKSTRYTYLHPHLNFHYESAIFVPHLDQ